eukprot:1155976-Pelagomonas_calceolata.AAC.4
MALSCTGHGSHEGQVVKLTSFLSQTHAHTHTHTHTRHLVILQQGLRAFSRQVQVSMNVMPCHAAGRAAKQQPCKAKHQLTSRKLPSKVRLMSA